MVLLYYYLKHNTDPRGNGLFLVNSNLPHSAGLWFCFTILSVMQLFTFQYTTLIHKLYVYLTYLLKKLPKEKGSTIHLADEIALEYYAIKKTFEGSASLTPDDENVPVTPVRFTGTGVKEEEKEYLSNIIERLNKRFGTDFTKADQLSVEQIKEDFAADEDLV